MNKQFKQGDWIKVVEIIRIRGGYIYPGTRGKVEKIIGDSIVLNFGGDRHTANVNQIASIIDSSTNEGA